MQRVDLQDAKEDHPCMTAQYIHDHYTLWSKNVSRNRVCSWASKTLNNLDRAVKRVVRAKKKDSRGPRTMVWKYGVEVPCNMKHVIELDNANGNTLWQDAMALEIKALQDMNCFKFRDAGDIPPGGYQHTTLHMVFDSKQEMRRNARLVVGGHLVKLLDNEVCSSTVKGIIVKRLHVLAHSTGLDTLCSNIGNAYVNAFTMKKVYAIAGLKFGPDLVGNVVVI
eukprot:2491902-Ditylum_brightwellii.AAC.2